MCVVQVRPLLGITVGASPDLPGVLGTWQAVVVNVGEARWKDATMGVTGIAVLLALRVYIVQYSTFV